MTAIQALTRSCATRAAHITFSWRESYDRILAIILWATSAMVGSLSIDESAHDTSLRDWGRPIAYHITDADDGIFLPDQPWLLRDSRELDLPRSAITKTKERKTTKARTKQ